MISPNLRIDGFDLQEWSRLRRLMLPLGADGTPSLTPPLVVLLDGGRPVKALRPLAPAELVEERLEGVPWQGPGALGDLRRRLGARVAVSIELEAALRITTALDAGLSARQDLVEQVLVASRAAKAELGRGVQVDPDIVSRLPVPSYAALQQVLDGLLPDDRAAALFVFDDRGRSSSGGSSYGHGHGAGGGSGIHASVIVEKRGGHIVRVTSHRALGLSASGLREFQGGRHRALLEAIERRVARPHAALFCTLTAWREIAGPEIGALARQVALRGAVIDPIPPWLLALTSIGAAASMAQGASKLFGRFVPDGIKQTARALTATPFAALGFDPIQLYAELRKLL